MIIDGHQARRKIADLRARLEHAKDIAAFMRTTNKPQSWHATADFSVTQIHNEIQRLEEALAYKACAPFAVRDLVWFWMPAGGEWVPGVVVLMGEPGGRRQDIVVSTPYVHVGGKSIHELKQKALWPDCERTLLRRDPLDDVQPPYAPKELIDESV